MKKLLIGLGLAAMLSGCVSTGLIAVFSDDIDFRSNYVLRSSGSPDRYVICRNKDTEIYLDYRFSGSVNDFASFNVQLSGTTTGQVYSSPTLNVSPQTSAGVEVRGSRIRVAFTFAPNTVPYNKPVSTQAVVVTPTNPTPIPTNITSIGFLNLNLKITDSTGSSASSNFLVNDIRVYNNCP